MQRCSVAAPVGVQTMRLPASAMMREQWCSDAANQSQRCRIQRRAAECVHSAECRQQRSSAGSGLWFREISIAACNCSSTRMPNVRETITDGPQLRFGRGAKPRQGLLKPKAEGRVGRLGGMRQEPMRALLGFARSYKTRTNLTNRFLRLFQSFGALYFPHDHSQGHPETRVGRLVTKIGRVARVRWRARGRIVVARDSARTPF